MADPVADSLLEYRKHVPALEECVHFISHSLGCVPAKAKDDLCEFFELWRTKSITAWSDWPPEVDRAAARIEKIISAPQGTVIMHQNVSTVMSVLASCFVGASKDVIRRWAKAYQGRGEAGLQNRIVSERSRRKLPGPVREKIVEIKKRDPLFGVKRIIPSIEAYVLPQREPGDGAADAEERIVDCSLQKETPAQHHPSQVF